MAAGDAGGGHGRAGFLDPATAAGGFLDILNGDEVMNTVEEILIAFGREHPDRARGFRTGYSPHHPDTTLSVSYLLSWYVEHLWKNPPGGPHAPFAPADSLSGKDKMSLSLLEIAFLEREEAGDYRGAAMVAAKAAEMLTRTVIGRALDAARTAPNVIHMAADQIREFTIAHYSQIRATAGRDLREPPGDDVVMAHISAREFLDQHPEHAGDVKLFPGGVRMRHAALEAYRDWLIKRSPESAAAVDLEYRKAVRQGPVD